MLHFLYRIKSSDVAMLYLLLQLYELLCSYMITF